MKKCSYCGDPIDVDQGGYANVYAEAWKMESYHLHCYTRKCIESELPPGTAMADPVVLEEEKR